MSQHFYPRCAHFILIALDQKSSVKGIVSSQCPVGPRFTLADQKRYLATVISLLAWRGALLYIVRAAGVYDGDKQIKRTLAMAWSKYIEQSGCKPDDHMKLNNEAAVHELLLVLTHEMICSPSKKICTSLSWPPHRIVASHRPRLHAELTRLQIKKGKAKAEELRSDNAHRAFVFAESGGWERGRWLRVNRRRAEVDDVVKWLQSKDYRQHNGAWLPAYTSRNKPPRLFVLPPATSHAADLILVPLSATAELVASEIYKAGKIVLQDAASCWPAQLLLGPGGTTAQSTFDGAIHVLDATAAPGNKTSHLSALVSTASRSVSVKITALERDPQRYKILRDQLDRFGCLAGVRGTSSPLSTPGLVEALRADFLSMEPSRLTDVTHILLDPSCSGSGIAGRLDWLTSEKETYENDDIDEGKGGGTREERLRKLSDVQVRMIEHAFQSCPRLERLVYSTCSIHRVENEDVVFRALNSPHARGGNWRWTIADRQSCLPDWPWRGEEGPADEDVVKQQMRQGMLRAYPYAVIPFAEDDTEERCHPMDEESSEPGRRRTHVLRTNGFFAACFVKERLASENDFCPVSWSSHSVLENAGAKRQNNWTHAKRRKKQRQKNKKRQRLDLIQVNQRRKEEWKGCGD